jgi:uncharacterized membrane protein
LPVLILFIVFNTLFRFITNSIKPLTNIVTISSHIQGILAEAISLAAIIVICFIIGVAIKTRTGVFFHNVIETRLLEKIPGYGWVKDTVKYFGGGQETPFRTVALVRLFGGGTLQTAFVTDSHSDGSYTVYVPLAPTLAQGNVCHVQPEDIFILDAPVENGIRSVVSCGAGSKGLIEEYKEKYLSK